MKRFIQMFVVLVFMLSFLASGCSYKKVPAGYVGIKVNLLGKKGVDTEELSPGRYIIGFNEELFRFPTFTQNYIWTRSEDEGSPEDQSINFQTSEGLTVSADVGISYRIEDTKVNEIFQKYRRGIDEITDIYLRNMVRDAFVDASSRRSVETVYGAGKSELLLEVEEYVRSQVEPLGIIIEKIYLIGELRLPPTVVEALNRKVEAKQRAEQRENELREAEAEAKKKIAAAEGEAQSLLAKAKAEAESNRLVSQSITPTLVKYRAIDKWNGEIPKFMSGGGAIPFIDISLDN